MREPSMLPPVHPAEAVVHADPWPYYGGLRAKRPLYFDGNLGLWIASTHAIVEEALAHPALRVRPPSEPVPRALLDAPTGEVFAQLVRMTDGEFHATHKPGVEQAARRWTLAEVAKAADEAATHLAGTLPVNALMSAVPVQAIARLLGVPDDARDQTCLWAQHFSQGIAPGASPEAIALASAAARGLMAQGEALGLAPAQAANRIAFMQQSLDATAGLIGLTALMLAREARLAVAADVSLDAMRDFVAEVERYCAPVQNTRRFAAGPLALGGQAIEAGQGVLLLLASANRDEALNARPDTFDPQRANRRTMGFGSGRHACPGAAIAIEIAASAVRVLRAAGGFDARFARHTGFRPLGNARVPVFEE